MELSLVIYDGKKVEKVYKTDTYDLQLGTLEDILQLIDATTKNNTYEILSAVSNSLKQLKPMLKDIFEGLTDDELRRTKVKDVMNIFSKVFNYAMFETEDISEKN